MIRRLILSCVGVALLAVASSGAQCRDLTLLGTGCGGAAPAGFTLIANQGASSGDGVTATTAAINTTGANLIVINATAVWNGTIVITDSKLNTWTALTPQPSASQKTALFYVSGGTVGAGHTFTVTATSGFPSIQVSAWSGADASPFDQESGTTTGSATTIQPGSLTPSVNNALVITGFGFSDTGVASINGGFAISNQNNASANAYGGAMAYLVQTTATAANPTWTLDTARLLSAAMVVFKPAP